MAAKKATNRPVGSIQDLDIDSDGFLHFKEGCYEQAPEWKWTMVGLLNEIRRLEKAGKIE
jgi:hypothetical protein